MKPIILLLSLLLPLSAVAATKVTVTVQSTPSGATLSQEGQTMGQTPWVLTYELRDFKACQLTKPLTVTWASGASATQPLQLCPAGGKKKMYTFGRPADAPNIPIDWQVEYQQTLVAQLGAMTRDITDPPPPAYVPFVAPPRAQICTTRHVANGVDYVQCW